jgi:hypothetical protein
MPAQYAPFRVQIPRDTLREIYLYGQDRPDLTMGDIVQQAVRGLFTKEGWQPRSGARVRNRRPGRRMRARCPRDLFVLLEEPGDDPSMQVSAAST